MRKDAIIKKIGHNLDTSMLVLAEEVYSGQQISFSRNLLLTTSLFESQSNFQGKSYFETLSTLTITYYKKTTNNSQRSYFISDKNTTLTTTVEYQE